MRKPKRYQVEVHLIGAYNEESKFIDVPDRCANEYEKISKYGLNAVLERARRSRAYKTLVKQGDLSIRSIILPNGERVTEF